MVQRELTQEEIEAIDSLNGQTAQKAKSFLSKSTSSSVSDTAMKIASKDGDLGESQNQKLALEFKKDGNNLFKQNVTKKRLMHMPAVSNVEAQTIW